MRYAIIQVAFKVLVKDPDLFYMQAIPFSIDCIIIINR